MSPVRMGYFLLILFVSVHAHNWMHSPGRASFQASTVAPCQPRKDSDLHAQVIRGQRFTMRFATGHDRNSYFVTLMGTDAAWMANDNFQAMVDDYLDNATSGEDHLSTFNRRYHGYVGNRGSEYTDPQGLGAFFTGPISINNSAYPYHPREEADGMFGYKDSQLVNDKRAAYVNPKYPWIISAARLPHIGLPDDFDAFHWTIPSQSNVKDGHVIVHWRWEGYYDCVDVDLRPGTTPVTYPNGLVDPNSHIWSQVDHCQYEDPISLLGKCIEVIDTVQPCIDQINQGPWNTYSRFGLNVVPFRNPATVNPSFASEVYIPWRNRDCLSSWGLIPGSVSETQLDWATWLTTRVTITTGVSCASHFEDNSNYDLQRAVAFCAGVSKCTGIAWETQAGTTVQSPGKKRFRWCSTTGTPRADSGWTLYMAKPLTPATYQTNTVQTINFAPLSRLSVTPVVAGMVTDAGYMYGPRNGQVYGWSCNTTVDCNDCCSASQCSQGQAPTPCCNGDIDATYAQYTQDRCPQQWDNPKWFNYDLPNGVYEVTTRHKGPDNADIDAAGCNVENVRMVKKENDNTPAGTQLTAMVEVTDGKLTFNGDGGFFGGGCTYINWIKFQYKGPVGTWGQTLMPPATANPIWEQNAGSPVPVGLVRMQNLPPFVDGFSVCSTWWLFKGSYCNPNRGVGWFNDTSSQGAIVGVSNVSCLTGNCAGFVQCGVVQLATVSNIYESDYHVDCKGQMGQYIVVKLPGPARYHAATISAYRSRPADPVGENPRVCYPLESRMATTTTPEFIISLDPEDPIFYSTCYVRNPNVVFLPLLDAAAPAPDRWRFNGRCLTCDTFKRNLAINKLNFASVPAIWELDDGQCVNCYDEPNFPLKPDSSPTWVQTYMNSCEDPATTTTNRGLPSCIGAPFSSCNKRLFARGRIDSENGYASILTLHECQVVAARDPECSSSISYEAGSSWSTCMCSRSHPCCGICTPVTWGSPRTANYSNNAQIYDRSVNPAPDAFCTSGLKSADNSLCCPATCKSASGANVCGDSSNCKNAVGGATCCKGDNGNLFVNMCSVHGPPCRLV